MHECIFFAAWFIAGFINGLSGLGAALVAVPVIAQFIEPHTIVPVATFLALVLCAELGWLYRKYCLLQQLKILTVGSVPGLVGGAYVLLFIPAHILLFCIGCIMVCYVVWQLYPKTVQKEMRESPLKILLAGFLSGFLSTSVSFGGPPVAVYALQARWGQKETVSTMSIFVIVSTAIALIVFIGTGLFTLETLKWCLLGTPAVTFGFLFSIPFMQYVKLHVFRKILLFIVGAGGISCIVNALGS